MTPESRFRGLGHAAALAREVPPTRLLVESLIEAGTVGTIAALPESHKSFLAVEIAHKVAVGGQVLGRFPVTQRGPVGFFWQDDSEANELARIQAYARRHDFTGDLPICWYLNEGLQLPGELPALRAEIEREHYALVVLDSLYNFLPGVSLKDEDVAGVLGRLKTEICDETGCAVCFVDHAPWPTEGNRGQRRGYGSVFKAAAIRWGIYLERDGDKLWVEARGNNVPGLKRSLATWDEDALELHLVDSDRIAPNEYEERILDYLSEHPWATTTELEEEPHGRAESLRAARKKLQETGRIYSTPSNQLGRPGTALRWNIADASVHATSNPVPLSGTDGDNGVFEERTPSTRPSPVGGTGFGTDGADDLGTASLSELHARFGE